MKFSEAFRALSELFASSGLDVWPNGVVPANPPLPHGIVFFIPNGAGANYGSVSGIIVVDIITAAGSGPATAHMFADSLDEFLVRRSHKGTQLFGVISGPSWSIQRDLLALRVYHQL
ncbi:hypothetical protein [EBPR siphovirus 1]|nr:hypothetical protein [EBPR siphovirus 1]